MKSNWPRKRRLDSVFSSAETKAIFDHCKHQEHLRRTPQRGAARRSDVDFVLATLESDPAHRAWAIEEGMGRHDDGPLVGPISLGLRSIQCDLNRSSLWALIMAGQNPLAFHLSSLSAARGRLYLLEAGFKFEWLKREVFRLWHEVNIRGRACIPSVTYDTDYTAFARFGEFFGGLPVVHYVTGAPKDNFKGVFTKHVEEFGSGPFATLSIRYVIQGAISNELYMTGQFWFQSMDGIVQYVYCKNTCGSDVKKYILRLPEDGVRAVRTFSKDVTALPCVTMWPAWGVAKSESV